MGLLSVGKPMTWEEMKEWQEHVRHYGVKQFIKLYNRLKDEKGRVLKWGDEVEYMIVKLDHESRKARLSLRAEDLLDELTQDEEQMKADMEAKGSSDIQLKSLWRPEYASYMVEGTPGTPYGGCIGFFNTVEHNMRMRRQALEKLLKDDEICISLSAFPRLGCPDFTDPATEADPENPDNFSKSLFWPSEATFLGHPRFSRLSANIRERRGEKVAINIPIYKDVNTPDPFLEDYPHLGSIDGKEAVAAKPDHVYMDAMGFGMGLCCLQLTFQADNIAEARNLYDQLTPLCPIMLALTATTPAHRGYLVDTDCRWDIISASVDDRTREERGLDPLKNNQFVIPKSRYDSIDSYLSTCAEKWPHYNDIEVIYDKKIYNELREGGVDELMAQHVAHLFIRDSVSMFRNKIKEDGNYEESDLDHFENIQSTNWQTMRFKPPPPGDSIGWRVEFRPCELQISDFENAAVCCFVVLLTRALLSYKWNLLIPISLVDENMKRAQKRDAVLTQKFYWRTDIFTLCDESMEPVIQELSIDEIINGIPGTEYQGLLTLVREYLRGQDDVEVDTSCTLSNYWRLLSQRASGKLETNAHWIREFIRKHPEYKGDSVVPDGAVYDLMVAIDQIQKGTRKEPKLFANAERKTKTKEINEKA
eukprot:TRINITY_DN12194_c0_g1_i2.p1 TRINITY_DN12194_c0_g1~~TRINITY_DN12194_c0_g1_i2.p1  ORF type:complete len:647 (-),score=161.02 TRINITY_DN12194_c0_g1_i2:122-2062(-)